MENPAGPAKALTGNSLGNPDQPAPVKVELIDQPAFAVIPFAISLPTSTLQGLDDPPPKGDPVGLMGDKGIVGSIVIMGKKSAMIWVGWGQLELSSGGASNSVAAHHENGSSGFGKGAPTMGQLTVAMPRTNYKGAFGTGAKEASCSQLIGCSSSEDQMLAHQMASRLSTRSGMAIYVSCQLSSSAGGNNVTGFDPDGWDSGLDSEMISHRAASLAEKEVWRILQNHQQQTS